MKKNIKDHNFDTLKRLILLFKQWPDCFIINVQWSGHNNKNTWWIHMKRVMVSDSSSMSRSCSVQRLNQDVYSSSLLFGAQSWSSGTMRFLGYQPKSGFSRLNPCMSNIHTMCICWTITFRTLSYSLSTKWFIGVLLVWEILDLTFLQGNCSN